MPQMATCRHPLPKAERPGSSSSWVPLEEGGRPAEASSGSSVPLDAISPSGSLTRRVSRACPRGAVTGPGVGHPGLADPHLPEAWPLAGGNGELLAGKREERAAGNSAGEPWTVVPVAHYTRASAKKASGAWREPETCSPSRASLGPRLPNGALSPPPPFFYLVLPEEEPFSQLSREWHPGWQLVCSQDRGA